MTELRTIATSEDEGGMLTHEPLSEDLGKSRVISNEGLARHNVPVRYRNASWEAITPELEDDVRDYCRNIVGNLRSGHGITLVGGVGVGKTHALVLVVDAALQVQWRGDRIGASRGNAHDEGDTGVQWHTTRATVEWTLGPKLYSVLHHPDAPGHREKIARYEACDLLVIDDFDRLYATDWNVMQLEALLEVRHSELRATALSLNSTNLLKTDQLTRTLDRLTENSIVVKLGKSVESRRGAEPRDNEGPPLMRQTVALGVDTEKTAAAVERKRHLDKQRQIAFDIAAEQERQREIYEQSLRENGREESAAGGAQP